jgi:predicted amidohydrolase
MYSFILTLTKAQSSRNFGQELSLALSYAEAGSKLRSFAEFCIVGYPYNNKVADFQRS